MSESSGKPPALFDTFNARFLDPYALGRSFIMPTGNFEFLCKPEHTLLIGPRGSGKTTLLRMLTPTALRSWSHSRRNIIINTINFRTVYVGADSGWTERIAHFAPGSDMHSVCEILRDATLVAHALHSMLSAIQEYANRDLLTDKAMARFHLTFTKKAEQELVDALAQSWRLEPRYASISAAKVAVVDRLSRIDAIYWRMVRLKEALSPADLAHEEFLFVGIQSVISTFVYCVEEIVQNDMKVWSFCIDELEILSDEFQSTLIRSLRSTSNQNIRLKISASPFSTYALPQADPRVPMSGNDFTPITLSFAKKQHALDFSIKMLSALLTEYKVEGRPEQLFGDSLFQTPLAGTSKSRAPYRSGGVRNRALRELQIQDRGFAKYVHDHRLDLDTLDTSTEDERAEVRKIIQVAEIRRRFGVREVSRQTVRFDRGAQRSTARRPSPKRIDDLYTGTQALLTLCEGNPRWLIGLFRPLIDGAKQRGRVPRADQARSVESAIVRYRALLSTIAYPLGRRQAIPFVEVVDQIGGYFFEEITGPVFKPEPVLTFRVDRQMTDAEVAAIGASINQGAFVFIPEDEKDHCMGDIRDRRFRMSYLLCPWYQIPLTYGKVVSLSKIVKILRGQQPSQYTLREILG